MKPWLFYALIALILWGLWGLFAKMASASMPPRTVFTWVMVGAVMTAIISVLLIGWEGTTTPSGIVYSLLAGAGIVLGEVAFLYAISNSGASIVVTITALYPLVTIVLAFFVLHEAVSLRQAGGILLGLLSIGLLAV